MKNINMKPEGLGKYEKGRIYRELDGVENGILYYEDSKLHLLVRQALPQRYDASVAQKTRKEFLSKILCTKIVNGRKVFTTAYKICGKEADEKVINDIKRGAGGQNGQMSVLVFNTKTAVPICAADIYTVINNRGLDYENGEIQFSFLPGVSDSNQKMVKRWLKNLLIKERMFSFCCEIKYDPYKDVYHRVGIE